MTAPTGPIFVVGNSRSGTTMMGRVLGQHPLVFTFDELHFFEQLWKVSTTPETIDTAEAQRLMAMLLTIQYDGYLQTRQPDQHTSEAAAIVATIEGAITAPAVFDAFMSYGAAANGKVVGCDQTPRNLYYLTELLALYPGARAVIMVRDARDVMLSQKNKWKRRRMSGGRHNRISAVRSWANFHPYTMSILWRGGVRVGDRYSNDPRVVTVRFEDLAADPEGQVRRLCTGLGLDFAPAMLAVPKVGSSAEEDRPDELGIDASAIGRWRAKLTPTEVWTCQKVAGPELAAHGYELADVDPSMATVATSSVSFAAKSVLAVTLNLGRSRSIIESAKRRLARPS